MLKKIKKLFGKLFYRLSKKDFERFQEFSPEEFIYRLSYSDFFKGTPPEETVEETFLYEGNDRQLMDKLCKEINSKCTTYKSSKVTGRIKDLPGRKITPYFMSLTIPGAGEIVSKYIDDFESEHCRAYLVHHIASDKVLGEARHVLNLYCQLKDNYVYKKLNNVHILMIVQLSLQYDRAHKQFSYKELLPDIIELAKDPQNLNLIGSAILKFASKFKPEELESIFYEHVAKEPTLKDEYPHYVARDFDEIPVCCSIKGLEYYPSKKNLELLEKFLSDRDFYKAYYTKKGCDFEKQARKSLEKIRQKLSIE